MYLLIPFVLILASTGGILFIVRRKLPQLKKLAEIELNSVTTKSSDSVSMNNDWRVLVYDLCPEVWDWARGVKVKEYKEAWLVETEKLLRRLRLVSLKMDRFSDSLIKKIRKHTYPGNGSTFSAAEEGKEKQDMKEKEDDKAELRKNEQKLIIEIAKNPKNAAFYEELGDLYVKMGGYRDAKESYEAAIELNPDNEEFKKKLSQALEKLNNPEGSQG